MLNESLKTATKIKDNALIYNNSNIKVYYISSFNEAYELGKGTQWCTSLNQGQFDLYHNVYDMYIINNNNRDDNFSKICYLVNNTEEMIVDKNNIHYFSDNKNYLKIKREVIPDFEDK